MLGREGTVHRRGPTRGEGGRSPLVNFDTRSRAQLSILEGISVPSSKRTYMPAVTRRRSAGASQRRKGSAKVRIVGGRVKLRVAGFSGVQSLSPSHLVRHIASSKLKAAAKKVLNKLGKKSPKRRRRRRRRLRKKRKKARRKGKKRAAAKRKKRN